VRRPLPRWQSGLLLPLIAGALTLAGACGSNGDTVTLGATTSLEDSGILAELLSAFEERSDYEVRPLVVGTGQVLELARQGEVDITLTHSPDSEESLIADGETIDRRPVMQNTFVLAGPAADPAGVRSASSLVEAMAAVALAESAFVSRGDESGTHVRELSYWEEAGIDPVGRSWYQESGVGQGQSLLIAGEREAYTVTDAATFLVLRDRLNMVAYVADSGRPNLYSAMLVNPVRHGEVAEAGALALLEFLVSEEARRIIAEFGGEEYGQPLFQAPPSD
jgi:tungstate transport system substrate-binding protein